jgi:hypothetical protein
MDLQNPNQCAKARHVALGMDELRRADEQRWLAFDEWLNRLMHNATHFIWNEIWMDSPGCYKEL